jgi:hypothetical protein
MEAVQAARHPQDANPPSFEKNFDIFLLPYLTFLYILDKNIKSATYGTICRDMGGGMRYM